MSQRPVSLFFRSLRGGGAERVMANLARGLADRGYAVDLILTAAEGVYLDDLPSQVRVIPTESLKPLLNISLPGFSPHSSGGSLLRLAQYLRQELPQVLLGATHFINEVAIAAKYLAGVNTPVWVAEHTTLSLEAQSVEQRSSRLAPMTSCLCYPWATGVIAVSAGVAQDLARLTGLPCHKIAVVYNPVLTPELFQFAQADPAHPWFAPDQPPVILGAGRFVAQKDFRTLIEAFALVRRRRLARLVLIGGGRQHMELQLLIKRLNLDSDVDLLDFIHNPYALMAKAAVFVQSSRWEGLPTVLIEALALGTPVVATDCPSGAREILQSGRYGTLVPVGQPQAIAAAIEAVLDLDRPKIRVPEDWTQQFSLQTAVQRYIEVLQLAPP